MTGQEEKMTKKILIVIGLLLTFSALYVSAAAQDLDPGGETAYNGHEIAPDQLLVRFKPHVNSERVGRILGKRAVSLTRRIRALDVHVLRLPPGMSVEQGLEFFRGLPEVEFVEPNYVLWAQAPARDEINEIVDQWGLQKIQAPAAWQQIKNETPVPPPVLVAVVDTGIDRTHTDLTATIWANPDETAGNGLDDDGNGYVDDTWGWDFRNNDNDPIDDNKHGTLVSSIAAGVQDGSGVAGVCPWCKLMAVKVLDANGSATLDTVANGIIYAADNGAQVINLSLGGAMGAQTLENAVDHAWNQGALVVAAAGNNGTETLFYPAAYGNVMSVASSNDQDYRSCFSNYSEGFISVAAPGENVVGAMPGPEYGHAAFNGTSLAAPHVSGLGALLLSQDPSRTNVDVRTLIEATTEDLGPTGTDAFFGTGRINALRAVNDDRSTTDPPAGLFSDDVTSTGYAYWLRCVG